MTGRARRSTEKGPLPAATSLVPGSIADRASCLLTRLGQVTFRLQERALRPLGVRVRHFSVLQALADLGPTGQVDLGRHLRIDPATMAGTLDHLESLMAVTRERDPSDRRRYVVALTDDGARLLSRIVERLVEVESVLEAELGQPGLGELQASLDVLARSRALAGALEGHDD